MDAELKKLMDQLGRDWNEFKSAQLEKIAKGEKASTDLDAKITKISASIDEAQKAIDTANATQKQLQKRLDEFEADRDAVGPQKADKAKAAKQKHLDAYTAWLRDRRSTEKAHALMTAEREVQVALAPEGKATAISLTAAAGGYAVPEILVRQIFDQAQLYSPLRQEVMVIAAANSDIRLLVNKHGASTGWVGETTSRSATTTPDIRERVPTFGTLYSFVSATEESVNDIGFDVGSWIAGEIAQEFAKAEGAVILTGSGSNRPTGLLNTTPVTTDDGASPERAAAALEYIPLDTSSPSTGILAPLLMDLIYGLRSEYRVNAKFACSSLTLGVLRKLRDTTGQFLWQPSLQAGQPSTLAGYPVIVCEDMATTGAAGRNVLLFGDFKRGYVLVDLSDVRTTVDDNITVPGYIKWYFRRRMGGCILDNYAIKVGRTAAA